MYSNPIQKLALAYGNNTATQLARLTLQSGAQVLAGTVAASTEAFYDITSYLYGFWN